jgi:hypothetical protein
MGESQAVHGETVLGSPGGRERLDLWRIREVCTPEQLTELVHRCAGVRGGGTEGLAFNEKNRKIEENE